MRTNRGAPRWCQGEAPEAPVLQHDSIAMFNLFLFNTYILTHRALEPVHLYFGLGWGRVCKIVAVTLNLYQESRGYRYNLTRFGSPDPGLIFTNMGKFYMHGLPYTRGGKVEATVFSMQKLSKSKFYLIL